MYGGEIKEKEGRELARFRRNTIKEKLMKATWMNCLKDKDNLLANWLTARGVLVGILAACPLGHTG